MSEPPILCTLAPGERAQRRTAFLQNLLGHVLAVEQLANGYRWRFKSAPGLTAQLGSVIEAERQCCRFLTFDLHASPDLGQVLLDVTGPDGTKAILADWL
ncbi:MAG TPA: hypothetical protein VL243_05980 [Vicinamibacterales bacterium]|nr:hypothetical protein [Vicinamibacterales bacterium]